MIRSLLVALLLLTSSTVFSQHTFQKTFPVIDRYIDSFMKDWNIPGLALGIVYNDQLIYSKGYGYRDLEQKLPVQTTTLFPIASNTKLFTATVAAMLEDEGKLSLDKPVRTYMPTLAFNNDELNARVTLRDMLSHRTGLPTYDWAWVGTDMSRKEAVAKVVHMKPQLGFREGYIYNNSMYTAAGHVLEGVTGKSWEDLVLEKLFIPLHMQSTVFTNEEMKKTGNYAIGYFEKDSTRTLLPKRYEAQSRALGPAGTIKSTVEDMSHWMIAQLNEGRFSGKQVIPAKAIRATLVPNIISDREGKYEELSNSLYALGRHVQTYKGHKIAAHTGSIDGFYSSLTFIPGARLGVFMVHNGQAGGAMRGVMALPVIDRLLQLSHTPWSQRYLSDYKVAQSRQKRAQDSLIATQVKGTAPSHPLGAYAGTYIHPMYGPMKVELVNNVLMLSFRRTEAPLKHFHYDQFTNRQEGTDYPWFRVKFLTNDKGEIDGIATGAMGYGEEIFVKSK